MKQLLHDWGFPALLFAVALLGGVYVTACAGMTLEEVRDEVGSVREDILALANLYEQQGREDKAAQTRDIADGVEYVEKALTIAVEGGGLPSDGWTAVQAAMDSLDALASESEDQDVQVAVFGINSILRRVQKRFPKPDLVKAPVESET